MKKIKESNGDYIFRLKGNHGTLHEEVKLFLDDAIANSGVHDYDCAVDGGHGRVEIRKVWYSENVQWMKDCQQWQGIYGLGVLCCTNVLLNRIRQLTLSGSCAGPDARSGFPLRSNFAQRLESI